MVTPSVWWDVLQKHGESLPTYRGDWTDYWNFGCISSTREVAINRQSRSRLRVADALAGALLATDNDGDPWLTPRMSRYRDEAWHNVLFWDEHTWGADCSIQLPDAEDTASQWSHKSNFAYRGRSQSTMLQRDALAALARRVLRENEDDILLVNPLPWPRTLTALVPDWVTDQRGGRDDTTAGRHFQDHILAGRAYQPVSMDHGLEYTYDRQMVAPQTVPAFGYTVVAKNDLLAYKLSDNVSEDGVVETDRHRLVFDREHGGVISWIDKESGREWVDGEAGYAFGGFVHEEVADRGHADAAQVALTHGLGSGGGGATQSLAERLACPASHADGSAEPQGLHDAARRRSRPGAGAAGHRRPCRDQRLPAQLRRLCRVLGPLAYGSRHPSPGHLPGLPLRPARRHCPLRSGRFGRGAGASATARLVHGLLHRPEFGSTSPIRIWA